MTHLSLAPPVFGGPMNGIEPRDELNRKLVAVSQLARTLLGLGGDCLYLAGAIFAAASWLGPT